MGLKRLFFIIIVVLSVCLETHATVLPSDIKDYLLKQQPSASIRFDGLVVFNDGTIYLPVIPAIVDKDVKFDVKYTFPSGKNWSDKPDIITFTNNYSFLKLTTTVDRKKVVKQMAKYPKEVKTGILPQDLVVPVGLVMPEELKTILGNLEIPTDAIKGVKKLNNLESAKTLQVNDLFARDEVKLDIKLNIPEPLKEKLFFVVDYNSEYIYIIPSNSYDAKFSLKLDFIPRDIKPTLNNKYLLVATANKTYLEVIDFDKGEIVKQIELGCQPTEILVSPDGKKAYVSSLDDQAIFVINLEEMYLTQKIKVKGSPEKMSFTSDDARITYVDRNTMKVYNMLLKDEDYQIFLIDSYPCVTKTYFTGENLYSVIRNKNLFAIKKYDKSVEQDAEESDTYYNNLAKEKPYTVRTTFKDLFTVSKADEMKIIKDYYKQKDSVFENKMIEVGKKPVDFLIHNDFAYVLCAQNNEIYKIDLKEAKVVEIIKLPVRGFSTKFVKVKNSNLALITNVSEKKYVIFNVETGKVESTMPICTYVSNLYILDKKAEKEQL